MTFEPRRITRRDAVGLGVVAMVANPFSVLAEPAKRNEAMKAKSFKIDVPAATIDDLKTRLAAARLPDQIKGSGWDYGTDTKYLADLLTYWRTDYDWDAEQARLNSFDHFKAEIDGLNIHFVHAKSDRDDAIPLLMLHGWPSSFVQMLDVIPMLTTPKDDGPAFHVVAASLPGYGFSDRPTKAGMSPAAMAPYMHKLMTDVLGYARYGIRSSDLGAGVASTMAASFGKVIGSHIGGTNPYLQGDIPDDLTPKEKKFVKQAQEWMQQEMAYAMLHSSKPQTVAVALNDSPAGLASWIVEKFWRWSDNKGKIEDAIDRDALLTNLTIYWVTQTINSSMHLYAEAARAQGGWDKPQAPVGYLMPKHDMFETPRSWIERRGPVAHWTISQDGGHFMEWEQPAIVADDLRTFFGALT